MEPKVKIGVLGSTRGSSLQYVIDEITTGRLNAEIAVVLSNVSTAPILDRARQHNIPCQWVKGDPKFPEINDCLDQLYEKRVQYDEKLSVMLAQYQVDIIMLVGYMKILHKPFVDRWKNKIINVHPSLLPKHKGLMNLSVHKAVLAQGDQEAGCTVHFIDEGVDTGEVILQKTCHVDADDNVESLKAKVQSLEGPALVEAIKLLSKEVS